MGAELLTSLLSCRFLRPMEYDRDVNDAMLQHMRISCSQIITPLVYMDGDKTLR